MSEHQPNAATAINQVMVRCPSCSETVPYRTDNPYRPFCSKGCKAIDLGAWASEQFRVEVKPKTEDFPDID